MRKLLTALLLMMTAHSLFRHPHMLLSSALSRCLSCHLIAGPYK